MSRVWGRSTRSRRRLAVSLFLVVIGGGGVPAALAAAGHDQLVQYPGAGFGGVRTQIDDARRSIDMEMYELADPTTERALVAAAARGVRVRVLLDQAFSGAEVNQPAVSYLRTRGVQVKWGPRGYIFHIKAISFDRAVSDISTANLVAKYYRTTRDAEIVDSDPTQVHAIEETFNHDWNAGPAGVPRGQTVQAPGLVWSPNTGSGTAETALVAQISSASHAVDFTSEELADQAIYEALAHDAHRGVDCRVVMTRSSDWNTAFQALTKAGCRVHVFPDSATALYIHEKLILDDPGRADASMFLGSQNASVPSLTRNRELALVLTNTDGGARAIAAASATFNADFAHATAWSAAKPAPPPHPTPAHCTPLTSSGRCYEAGEFCPTADRGMAGIAGNGEAIVCEDDNGWRWEPPSS